MANRMMQINRPKGILTMNLIMDTTPPDVKVKDRKFYLKTDEWPYLWEEVNHELMYAGVRLERVNFYNTKTSEPMAHIYPPQYWSLMSQMSTPTKPAIMKSDRQQTEELEQSRTKSKKRKIQFTGSDDTTNAMLSSKFTKLMEKEETGTALGPNMPKMDMDELRESIHKSFQPDQIFVSMYNRPKKLEPPHEKLTVDPLVEAVIWTHSKPRSELTLDDFFTFAGMIKRIDSEEARLLFGIFVINNFDHFEQCAINAEVDFEDQALLVSRWKVVQDFLLQDQVLERVKSHSPDSPGISAFADRIANLKLVEDPTKKATDYINSITLEQVTYIEFMLFVDMLNKTPATGERRKALLDAAYRCLPSINQRMKDTKCEDSEIKHYIDEWNKISPYINKMVLDDLERKVVKQF